MGKPGLQNGPLLSGAVSILSISLLLVAGCGVDEATRIASNSDSNSSSSSPKTSDPRPESSLGQDRDSAETFPGSCGEEKYLSSPEISGYETPWNVTPADSQGGILPYSEWPQNLLDHPAIAFVDSDTGTTIEVFDRTGCHELTLDPLPRDESWPEGDIVVIDITTGEILDSFQK